jgi:outer membrane lipoprotein-sorting protein
MSVFLRLRAVLLILTILPLSGCLFRSRKLEVPIDPSQFKTATQQQLTDYINKQAALIQSIQATVDIDTSVGGIKKGKVTEYQQIRGYVLARKPSMLRLIGLLPVVHNRAFDMVSDGQKFALWIPPKNRFVVGRNDVESHNPAQPLENLRPQHLYDALLLQAIDPKDEIAVLENDTEIPDDLKCRAVTRADYIIDVITQGDHGWYLSRKVVFSRTDLMLHRQIFYDKEGNVETNAIYWNYKDENGVDYPYQIEISRPKEEYDITLTIVKLDLNQPLSDDRFVLEQPPGAIVVHLDQPQSGPVPGSTSSNR